MAELNGIYAIFFRGSAGDGHGLVLLRKGTIAGADAAGAIYDGDYRVSEDGRVLNGSVTIVVPPGVSLATGGTAGPDPLRVEIPLRIPSDLGDGRAVWLKTPTGPVSIIFNKIRELD